MTYDDMTEDELEEAYTLLFAQRYPDRSLLLRRVLKMTKELSAARATLDSTILISANGTLYRALSEPVGYSGTAETAARVEAGELVVTPGGLIAPEGGTTP